MVSKIDLNVEMDAASLDLYKIIYDKVRADVMEELQSNSRVGSKAKTGKSEWNVDG